jgi:hypothetical protein
MDTQKYLANARLLNLLSVSSMLGLPSLWQPTNPKEINIQKLKSEYELIQQKKSKLSFSQRKQVIYLYEKHKENPNE